MGKKAASTKPASKKSGSKAPAKGSASAKAPKPAKPVAAKPAATKPAATKPKAPKPARAASKPAGKSVAKAPAPKPARPASKAPPKPVTKAGAKPAPKPATPPAPPPAKAGRKGITVVQRAPAKKSGKSKGTLTSIAPPGATRLLGPGGLIKKPLIASGPKAAAVRPLGSHAPEDEATRVSAKSTMGKRDLEHFRQLLLRKRAELAGDIEQMEAEALQGGSGSLSNLPQHMADQGSDTFDQSLALDLAAADRRLLREIEAALKRIQDGTYGMCEATGKPIRHERLEELPWARYSIEAARELERRSMWS